MKKIIDTIRSEPMLVGSFWVVVGTFLIGAGNYVFNLLMGRMLSTEQYGELMSLISLSLILALPATVINLLLAKVSAHYKASDSLAQLSRLFKKSTLYFGLSSIIVFGLFMLLIPLMQNLLHIDDNASFMMVGIMIGISIIAAVNRGFLQGFLNFRFLTAVGVVMVIVKLILGTGLVLNHYAVAGGIAAVLISAIVMWIGTYVPLWNLFYVKSSTSVSVRKSVTTNLSPVMYVSIATTLFLTTDVLLVKHFFDPHLAGIFAAVTVVGKVIYYIVGPISQVFLPVVSQHYSRGSDWRKDLYMGLLLTAVPGAIGIAIYFLLPDFTAKLFFPNIQYAGIASFIGLYAIVMVLFSLNSLFMNFFVGIENSRMTLLALLACIAQVVLILFYNTSIDQVIWIAVVINAVLLCVYLVVVSRYKNRHAVT